MLCWSDWLPYAVEINPDRGVIKLPSLITFAVGYRAILGDFPLRYGNKNLNLRW